MNTEQQLINALTGIVGIQEFLIGTSQRESIGQQILKSPNLKSFLERKSDFVTIELKTAITSTGAINDRLVPSMKPPIDAGVRRRLNIRDLIPTFPTENGAIELPVKSGSTSNAGPQATGSPLVRENVALGESAYTFTASYLPVQTIGHYAPVSSQIFEDAGTLDGFIQGEMAHGVSVAIENQIINGTGTTGSLTGLLAGATAWTQPSPNTTNELTIIRSAIRQIAVADFTANAIVLNPNDWFDIETRKAGTSDNTYVAGQPRLAGMPSLFGLPVIESNAIASGTFLVGDFARAAALFVRQGVTVEVSRHNSDNFTRNMVTILAQERLALVTANSLALCKGSL